MHDLTYRINKEILKQTGHYIMNKNTQLSITCIMEKLTYNYLHSKEKSLYNILIELCLTSTLAILFQPFCGANLNEFENIITLNYLIIDENTKTT